MSALRNSRRLIAVPLTMAALLCVLAFYKYSTMTHQYPSEYYAPGATCDRDFQVIEKDSAFAYSAYVDDRCTGDSVDIAGPVVRIFVYFDRAVAASDAWLCLFWYKDKADPVSRPVKRITNLDEFATLRFAPAMALCALPEFEGRTPQNVSVVSKWKNSSCTNYICIEDLRLRRSRLLEDTNGHSKSSSKKGNNIPTFTICTKAIIHDDRYNVHDIVNFIEVNRLLGADKFVFYADGKTADLLVRRCLDSYSEKGLVEVRPFACPSALERLIFSHGQIMTTTECMYSVMYRTEFVVSIDLDEFIVPRNESINWNQLLANIHKKNSATNGDRIAAYDFRNQFFPHQTEDDPHFANNTLVKLHRITTLLRTLKEEEEDHLLPRSNRSKAMARPEKVLVWPGHLQALEDSLVDKEDIVCHVQSDEALLFRYRRQPKTSKKKLIRERRMHRLITPQLIENIHFALGRCLPPD